MLELPRIYPITDTRISGLSHLEQVKGLIDGGASLIQLRDKDASPRDFYDAALGCVAYARPRGCRIIVNDRTDIALAARADGVHLGQDDMPPSAARELLGPGAMVGYSTHSLEQAIAARELPVDYIAIGPIFATTTKQNPDPVVGVERLREVKNTLGNVPLVAIGGINISNVGDVFTAGVDSVAVIGALYSDPGGIAAAMGGLISVATV